MQEKRSAFCKFIVLPMRLEETKSYTCTQKKHKNEDESNTLYIGIILMVYKGALRLLDQRIVKYAINSEDDC